MVTQLNIAVKTVVMYSLSHPYAQNAIAQGYNILKLALADKENITISLDEGILIVEGLPLDMNKKPFNSFAANLTERNIEGITFIKDLVLKEFQAFIELFLAKSEELKCKENIGSILKEKGVTHISVNETKYRKVSEKLEKLEDVSVTNYLVSKLGNLDEKEEQWINKINENPELIAGFIMEATTGMGTPAGVDPVVARVQNTTEILGRIGTQLTKNSTKDWRTTKKKLVEVLLNLDPELQHNLTIAHLKGENRPNAIVKEVLDQTVVDSIAKEFKQNNLSSEELVEVVQKLIPDQEKKKELLPLLKERLSQEGVTASELRFVSEAVLQDELPLEERFENVMQRSMANQEEIRSAKSLIFELFDKGKILEAEKVVDKFAAGLNSPSGEVRKEVADNCFSLMELFSKSEKLQGMSRKVYELMIQKIENEDQIEVYATLVETLTMFIKTASVEDYMVERERILKVLDSHASDQSDKNTSRKEVAEKAREVLVNTDIAEELLSDLKGDDEIKREEATNTFMNIVDSVFEFLIVALTEEGDRKVRAQLLKILESAGKESIETVKGYLNDQRWYVVRNMVRVLGSIGDESVVELVLPLLSHENSQVRKESILALLKIGSDKAWDYLVTALNDQNGIVQSMAIYALAEMGQEKAIPILGDFLKRGTSIGESQKKRVILSLGKIGGEDSVAILSRLLEKKGLFAKGESEDIRIMVVDALRKVGGFEAASILKKVALRDSARSIKEKAVSAMRSFEK